MRHFISGLVILIFACSLALLPGCDDGGGSTSTGSLIADFYIEGQEYLAQSETPLERLCSIFQPSAAYAVADLGFDSNCYPFNIFSSDMVAQDSLEVLVVSPSSSIVAHGFTSDAGRVSFTDINVGYMTFVVTGRDGGSYDIPTHVTAGTTSRTRALIYKHPATGNILITAKTIDDADGDGINDDSFSYSVFNRPRNVTSGGLIHVHYGGETRIDANGDGDFTDAGDTMVLEPDDDGVKSDLGDGDEDNDGIMDNTDSDIDGDGVPNVSDDDIDGDGVKNPEDTYPGGITPLDDFTAPGLFTGLIYTGIEDLAQVAAGEVSVFFPPALDDKHNPVTYLIFYSETEPVNIGTAHREIFKPTGNITADELLSLNVSGLLVGQTYHFVVRVMDSAQPPVIDKNTKEMSVTIE